MAKHKRDPMPPGTMADAAANGQAAGVLLALIGMLLYGIFSDTACNPIWSIFK